MQAAGERIIVFGDSTTHDFADNSPEIWDVDQPSERFSASPGSLMASLLLEQGAQAVRTNSRVGRSAVNFFGRENVQGLLASDRAFAPTKVVIVLGTNDIGMGVEQTRTALEQIREAYASMSAEVWAFGPYTYAGPAAMLNTQAEPYIEVMRDVFGKRFIDTRPLTVSTDRAGDGVHFGFMSARQTAGQMALALLEERGPMPWWQTGLIVGLGALAGLALWRGLKDRTKMLGYAVEGPDSDPREVIREFRRMVGDESTDPATLDVAEDLLLENGIKMSEAMRVGYSKDRGIFPLRQAGSHGETKVAWNLEPVGENFPNEWINQLEITIDGNELVWPREPTRRDPKHWGRLAHTVYRNANHEQASSNAAEAAWRVVKAIRRYQWDHSWPPTGEAEQKAVRAVITRALNAKPDTQRPELYGAKHVVFAEDEDPSFTPSERDQMKFKRLVKGDADDVDVAQDLALEKGMKLSEVSATHAHAPYGMFSLDATNDPREQTSFVSWTVMGRSQKDRSLARDGEIMVQWRNAAPIYIKTGVHGTYEYARKSATADAWAVVKALKKLPPHATIAQVTAAASAAVDKDNSEPSELYGHRDRLPGGEADKRSPSSFNRKQLEIGTRHEREHTNDPEVAREIAMDHLAEDSAYYKKLRRMELGSKVIDTTAVEVPPGGYRVAYVSTVSGGTGAEHFIKVVKGLDPQTASTIEGAQKLQRAYKRRGMTAWIEDAAGNLVPVKGAMRKPKGF